MGNRTKLLLVFGWRVVVVFDAIFESQTLLLLHNVAHSATTVLTIYLTIIPGGTYHILSISQSNPEKFGSNTGMNAVLKDINKMGLKGGNMLSRPAITFNMHGRHVWPGDAYYTRMFLLIYQHIHEVHVFSSYHKIRHTWKVCVIKG